MSDRKYSDRELEALWEEFSDVPMNPETECMEAPFLDFPAGTHREEIWHWFDERYTTGVTGLLYEIRPTWRVNMGDLYRSVEKLPEGALDYLRGCLYWGEGDFEYEELSSDDKAIVDAAAYPSAIPNDVVYRAYEGIMFVPEDFVADAGDDWSAV